MRVWPGKSDYSDPGITLAGRGPRARASPGRGQAQGPSGRPGASCGHRASHGSPPTAGAAWLLERSMASIRFLGAAGRASGAFSPGPGVLGARVARGILRMSPLCSEQQGGSRGEGRRKPSMCWVRDICRSLTKEHGPAWPRPEGRAAQCPCVCLVVLCLVGGAPC